MHVSNIHMYYTHGHIGERERERKSVGRQRGREVPHNAYHTQ